MLPGARARSSSRNSHSWKPDGVPVRKVRLKTVSGLLTLCYRKPSPVLADKSPEAVVDNALREEPSQVSSVQESAFDSLPGLFESGEQFSFREDADGCGSLNFLALPPDFSSYNFWASESETGLIHTVDLSETFCRCEDVGKMDAGAGLVPDILDHSGLDLDNSPGQRDPYNSQYSVHSSGVDEEIISNRKCHWDYPVELEEDLSQRTMDWKLSDMPAAGTVEKDEGGESFVDNFLVDRSPEFCSASVENPDNLLVYAANKYVEEACIFKSSPPRISNQESAIEISRAAGGARIQDSQEERSRKGVKLRQYSSSLGKRSSSVGRNIVSFPSIPESDHDVQDDAVEEPCETRELADFHHVQQYGHHRRRKLSAPRMKRSKLLRLTPISLENRSPTKVSRELKPGARHPIRKNIESVRRLLKPGYCSDSPEEESDHTFHKSPRQFSLSTKTRLVHQRVDVSLGESADALKELQNQSSRREGGTSMLNTNPFLINRRKRTAEIRDNPNISKTSTRIDMKSRLHDSPKFSKVAAGAQSGSPAIASYRRSPHDSPKKIRTFRRSVRSSPTSAKKLHFYRKILEGGASQLQQSPEVLPGKKLAGRRPTGVKRVPLPQESVEILQGWLNDNLSDPYPSRKEKDKLELQTGLKMSQIDNWLGNTRQKLKLNRSRTVKDASESSSSPEQAKKRSKRNRAYPLKMII